MVILETRSSTWEARRPRDPRGKIGGPESDFGGPSRREKGTPKKWAKAYIYIYIWFGAFFEVAKMLPKTGMWFFPGGIVRWAVAPYKTIKSGHVKQTIKSGYDMAPNTPCVPGGHGGGL